MLAKDTHHSYTVLISGSSTTVPGVYGVCPFTLSYDWLRGIFGYGRNVSRCMALEG